MGETLAQAVPFTDADKGDQSATPADHQEAMINKAEAGTDVSGGGNEEQLLAGKYKSEEDLNNGLMNLLVKQHGSVEAAYKALEAGQGGSPEDGGNADADASGDTSEDGDDPNNQDGDDSDDNTDDDSNDDYIDTSKFEEEYARDGKLSEESMTELEQAGYSRQEINTYFAGVQAQTNQVMDICGGQENYQRMAQWAANGGATEADIKAYDEAMYSGDMDRIRQAVTALNARYVAAEGTQNSGRIQPGQAQTGGPAGDTYGSWAQVQADMRDPRYSKDPAFVRMVETKLARSKF